MSKQNHSDPKAVEERYQREVLPEIAEHMQYWYASAFERPAWAVITAEEPDRIQLMQWCMVPGFVKDPKEAAAYASKTYNARSEDMWTRSTYKKAIENGQRCLIICTGFFEHRTELKQKYPYFIHLPQVPIFSMAGIYNSTTRTYSVITTHANELMAKIHNEPKRQPVIIPPQMESTWLRAGLTKEEVMAMCQPLASQDMAGFTISKRLTSREPRNVPEVMAPFEYPALAMLDA